MVISARNCLNGKIEEIHCGAVNAEVIISIDSKEIVATITNESVKKMGIKVGDDAFALIKASSIILTKDKDINISARNILETDVVEIEYGLVNAEVIMTLGSNKLVALITKESADNLMIKAGDKIFTIFKASSIIIGVN